MNFNKWIKGCIKKKRYEKVTNAEQAVVKAKKKWNADMRWYYCLDCQGYHLAKIRGTQND